MYLLGLGTDVYVREYEMYEVFWVNWKLEIFLKWLIKKEWCMSLVTSLTYPKHAVIGNLFMVRIILYILKAIDTGDSNLKLNFSWRFDLKLSLFEGCHCCHLECSQMFDTQLFRKYTCTGNELIRLYSGALFKDEYLWSGFRVVDNYLGQKNLMNLGNWIVILQSN